MFILNDLRGQPREAMWRMLVLASKVFVFDL